MSGDASSLVQWVGVAVSAGGVGAAVTGALMKLWAGNLVQGIKVHMAEELSKSETKMSGEILRSEHNVRQDVETAMHGFGESVASVRKHAEFAHTETKRIELQTERDFVSKEDFREFRTEYRKDTARQMDMLQQLQSTVSTIAGRNHQLA